MAAKDPDFARKAAPVLKQIKNLTDKLPLDKLPSNLSQRLTKLRDEIGEFLLRRGRLPGSSEVWGRNGLIKELHDRGLWYKADRAAAEV